MAASSRAHTLVAASSIQKRVERRRAIGKSRRESEVNERKENGVAEERGRGERSVRETRAARKAEYISQAGTQLV